MGKRTYEQSLTFFKRDTSKRGDGRELYKTPYIIIERIVENLLSEYPELKNKFWIDPCAGDGRWEDVIKKYDIKCKSYDLTPLNNNVVQQDFLTSSFTEDNLFFIGNPPFSLVKQFVKKSLEMADSCYFLGGSQVITGTLSNKVRLLHRFEGVEGNQKDLRSKISFVDTLDKEVYIWCCGALFDNTEHKTFNRSREYIPNYFATGVKCFCEPDDRIRCLYGK